VNAGTKKATEMKAKAAFRALLAAALACCAPLLRGQDQGPKQPGPGATWYLYWVDEGRPGAFAFVTDARLDMSESYATVWSKVYDPQKGTETTIMELYCSENDSEATVFLCERDAKKEVLQKVFVRHPETKLAAVSDAGARVSALYACLKGTMDLKPKDDAVRAFAKADKRLMEGAKAKPAGAPPAVWP
jgi:hypothetical protein